MALKQEKAERIAQEYAKIGYKDMTTPLLAVGYSQTYAQSLGHKLYRNIKVIEAIESIKANARVKTGITIEWVVNNLREVAERCLNAVPVLEKGKETGEWQFDAPGANKALQLLGMHVDAFNADNKSKAPDVRTYSLTQLQLILDADKARVKEIDAITGGIAGEEL